MNAQEILDSVKETLDTKTADLFQCLIAAFGEQSMVIKELQNRVSFLENKVNELERYSSKDCIIIHNLPLMEGSFTDDVLSLFNNVLGVEVNSFDLKAVHPLGVVSNNKPCTVIAKFVYFDLKNRVDEKDVLPRNDIEINEDISWEYMGKAEWFIIPKGVDLFHTGNQDVQAVIYKVRNKNKFPDCFDFLASLMKERRLSIDELESIKHLPPRWPFHINQSEYIDAWLRHAEFGSNEPFLHPMPLDSAWKEEEYKEWIEWLMQHPEQLRPQERQERTMKIGNVDVTFVHGDILDHLDWLESINASLVLRRKLLTKCLEFP